MQALCRDTAAFAGQHRVGNRRAECRNDFERFRPVDLLLKGVKDIEQPRVDRVHLTATEVAQQMVYGEQRIGDVSAGLAVFQIQRFAGMSVMEGKAPGAGCSAQQTRPDQSRSGERGEGKEVPPAGCFAGHLRALSEGQPDADCFRRKACGASLRRHQMANWAYRTDKLQNSSHSGLRVFAIAALLSMLLWLPAAQAAAPQSAVAAELQSDVRRLGEAGGIYVQGLAIASASLLTEFYASRNYVPVWTSEVRIDELFSLLATADSHGLDSGDYYLAQLRGLREQYRSSDDPALGAALDLLLTESLIRFGYHQRFGKVNPARMEPTWNFTRQFRPGRTPLSALQELVAAPALQQLLGQWTDRAPLYRALQTALADYRSIARAGGWPVIAPGPTLRQGDTDARVPALRWHLVIGGDLPPVADAADEYFDAVLADGVRAFQNRHALTADGIAGPATLAVLNIPVERRIDQLRLSLERTRWVADDTTGEVVVVNIAGSEVFAARNGQRFWTRRAVVGRVARKTPVFRGSMTWLELNPTWTIPPTILREDVLPRLRRDPGYLLQQGISVIDTRGRVIDPLTVDWEFVGNRPPYTFRQAPGPKNSLGRIKFMFPNPHAVFLHDTPARGAFERTGRLLSSGCVRIEDPLSLAEIVLADPGRWNQQTLQAAIDTGKTQTVSLPRPWPVLILYWTAELDAAGRVRFLPDVYNRDPALLAALNGEVVLEFPPGPG